jgi:dTDP-4-amino-4,6-dideoxygalactose transaminase
MLVRRKKIFDLYTRSFRKYKWAQIPEYETDDKTTSYHVYLLRIKGITEAQRDLIMNEIRKREVSVNVHFVPLPMMTYYKKAGYRISDYPVSFDNYSREISLPVYYDLTDAQVKTVIRAVSESVEVVLSK